MVNPNTALDSIQDIQSLTYSTDLISETLECNIYIHLQLLVCLIQIVHRLICMLNIPPEILEVGWDQQLTALKVAVAAALVKWSRVTWQVLKVAATTLKTRVCRLDIESCVVQVRQIYGSVFGELPSPRDDDGPKIIQNVLDII